MEAWEVAHAGLLEVAPSHPSAMAAESATGIYAWWDTAASLARFYPSDFPPVQFHRPLYIGIAERQGLDSRGARMHLKRTRMSGLRRSLAALLRDDLLLSREVIPARGGMYGLTSDGDQRLTDWMLANLQVSWVVHDHPSTVEPAIIGAEFPPLNYDHATTGPYAAKMRALRSSMRNGISSA